MNFRPSGVSRVKVTVAGLRDLPALRLLDLSPGSALGPGSGRAYLKGAGPSSFSALPRYRADGTPFSPPPPHTRSLGVSEKSQRTASTGKEWALGFQRGPHARQRVSGSAEARQSTRGRPGRSTAEPAATRPALRLARLTDALARPRKPGSPSHLPAPGLGLPAAALRGRVSEESTFLPRGQPATSTWRRAARDPAPALYAPPSAPPTPVSHPPGRRRRDDVTRCVVCRRPWSAAGSVGEVRDVCSQNEREKWGARKM